MGWWTYQKPLRPYLGKDVIGASSVSMKERTHANGINDLDAVEADSLEIARSARHPDRSQTTRADDRWKREREPVEQRVRESVLEDGCRRRYAYSWPGGEDLPAGCFVV